MVSAKSTSTYPQSSPKTASHSAALSRTLWPTTASTSKSFSADSSASFTQKKFTTHSKSLNKCSSSFGPSVEVTHLTAARFSMASTEEILSSSTTASTAVLYGLFTAATSTQTQLVSTSTLESPNTTPPGGSLTAMATSSELMQNTAQLSQSSSSTDISTTPALGDGTVAHHLDPIGITDSLSTPLPSEASFTLWALAAGRPSRNVRHSSIQHFHVPTEPERQGDGQDHAPQLPGQHRHHG